MTLQISVIASDRDTFNKLKPIADSTRLVVEMTQSVEQCIVQTRSRRIICVILDLPGRDGLVALESLRKAGLMAPAILVVDANADLPAGNLSECGALDVLEKPADKRALLGWIECVCAANLAIARGREGLLSAA